jgi:plastocyanin
MDFIVRQEKTTTRARIIASSGLVGVVIILLFSVSSILPIAAQAQQVATTTTVTIVQGAQIPSNEQFYNPSEVTAKSGSTVTWNNEDSALHTATSGKDVTPDGKFDTSIIAPGQSSQPVTMPTEQGEYPYFCTLHPWMTGTVIVT